MSARTAYYIKALVVKEQWFKVSAIDMAEAKDELKKHRETFFVADITLAEPDEDYEVIW